MTKIYRIAYIGILAAVMQACGSSEAGSDKLNQLAELKKQKTEIEDQITALEKELVESGQLEKKEGNKVLISAIDMAPTNFIHKVEIRGAVSSRRNVWISPEMNGRVRSIKVKEGQRVSKGQLLLEIDAAVIRNNITEVKTQLNLAKEVFERQERLWEKNIGTEIQYLQAKSNKESLESRLSTLRSQLGFAYVKAPFSGIVDDIPVKEGEMAMPGMPVIRLVNPSDAYIAADVSEAFLGKFKKGQEVEAYFPSQDKKVLSKIQSVGRVIKSENRTFEIEVSLPKVDFPMQPNQVVVLNLVDYTNEDAFVVPTKIVQKDSKGNFVYEIVEKEDKKVARKVHVEVGVSFDQQTEVVKGLEIGQLIAHEGYRDLAENVVVTIAK